MSARFPVRTCVGCASRAPQRTLLRVVMGVGGLAVDLPRRAPGRGAYLHRDPACWAAFVARRGPVRSLRASPARSDREGLVASLSATPLAGRAR